MSKIAWATIALSALFATPTVHAADLTPGAWYQMVSATTMTVIHNENPEQAGSAAEGSMVSLPADSEFFVQEVVQDPQAGWIVHLNIDTDPEGNLPSDFWVSADELTAGSIKFIEFEEVVMRKGRRGRGGGMTYCYRDVKNMARRLGVCKVYCSGSEANQGYSIMARECHLHAATYSASLPVGAICFSSGKRSCGNHKCGHVAIKTGKNRWYGAGTRAVPWVGSPKGCLVK